MSSARALWNSRLPESLKAGAGRPDGKSRSSGDRAAPHRSRPSATAPCSSLLPTGKISRLASDETCGTLQNAAPALRSVRSWCCEPGGWSDPEPEAPPYRRHARVDPWVPLLLWLYSAAVDRSPQAHQPHQTPDPFAVDDLALQPCRHPARAVIGAAPDNAGRSAA